ncbi:Abi family protein [Streptococcus pluranimalium]
MLIDETVRLAPYQKSSQFESSFALFEAYMKPFTNINQQINILKSRNLIFKDESRARQLLLRYGYYEIINGYKNSFLDLSNKTEKFLPDTTFEHLYSLYDLDKDIRKIVMQATLEIELTLRTAIAYTIAEDFGVSREDYLKLRNFRQGEIAFLSDGTRTNERNILLHHLSTIHKRNIEPLIHYRTKHGHIPPWILLKESTFGNLVHLYRLLKGPQKTKVISICYNIPIENITDNIKSLFNDSISVILSFRNRAAHSGRIFNFKSNKHFLKFNDYFHIKNNITPAAYRTEIGKSDIYTLSLIFSEFENESAGPTFQYSLVELVKDYCKLNPDDLEYITSEMNFPIEEFK